MANLAAHLP